MKRLVQLCIGFGILGILSGCSTFRIPSSRSTNTKQTTTTPAKTDVQVAKVHHDSSPNTSRGIKVTRLTPIQLAAGDSDGVYIGDHIDAIHLCTGEPVSHVALGSPRYGTMKAYATGHMRYYPPEYPCEEKLEIRLFCKDGCNKSVTLPINVQAPSAAITPTTAPSPRSPSPTGCSLSITSPSSGTVTEGRICRLAGKTNGLPEGTKLVLIVEDMYGNTYYQEDHPLVTDSHFSSWVYLGDADGHGVNDKYRIYAVAPNHLKSRKITVKRIN